MRGRGRLVALGAFAAAATAAPAASADQRIQAGLGQQYTTPNVTMDQGEHLTFQNLDIDNHDVTAVGLLGGQPLFSTPLIGFGSEVFVDDSQYLTTGSYPFYCSIHPFMRGTLNVSSAGTAVPRPGGGSGSRPARDRTPPSVKLTLPRSRVSRLRRGRRVRVRLSVSEASSVRVTATTRSRGRTRTLGRRAVSFAGAGTRTVSIRISRRGRRALRRGRRATIAVTARARDRAGNETEERASRRFRP